MFIITTEQQAIIESIKAQNPELKINWHEINNKQCVVVIVEQKVSVSESATSYIVVSLIPDTVYPELLMVKAASYNALKDCTNLDHERWMDKNDPNNLERCIRLAIKLLKQI